MPNFVPSHILFRNISIRIVVIIRHPFPIFPIKSRPKMLIRPNRPNIKSRHLFQPQTNIPKYLLLHKQIKPLHPNILNKSPHNPIIKINILKMRPRCKLTRKHTIIIIFTSPNKNRLKRRDIIARFKIISGL